MPIKKVKRGAKKVKRAVKYTAKRAKKNLKQRVSNAKANRRVKKINKIGDQAVRHSKSTRRERKNPTQYKALQISVNKAQTKKLAKRANKIYNKGKKKK